jgi:hypothetical protein
MNDFVCLLLFLGAILMQRDFFENTPLQVVTIL